MNYGRHGRDLLLELKRSEDKNGTGLPAYNDELVANCLQDFKLHVQALQDQVDVNQKPSMQVRPSILLQNAAIQRNKRCLLTYHRIRMQRIQTCYWQQNLDPKVLCPAEMEYLQDYSDLIQRYTQATCQWDDLRAHHMPPQPFDRCQVRVMDGSQFEGPIVLESGQSVVLSKGSTHYLLWSDVEEYVRNGQLQVLNGEEEQG